MIYFTADLHLGHYNIIRYCNRPFKSTDEMDKTIKKNWNEIVKPEDTVMVLGDVAFKNDNLLKMKSFNGKKILIRGNHDRGFTDNKFKEAGFTEIFKRPYMFIRLDGNYPVYINCVHAPNPEYFKKGAINLCGHVHDSWAAKYGFLNVGVDPWVFKPLSFNKVYDTYIEKYPDLLLRRTINFQFHELI